jgi:hypothetical protein
MTRRKFAPLTECQWKLEDFMGFVLAAERVRSEVDAELGELLLAASKTDTIEAWAKVHDRANVIGRHDLSDRLRQLIRGKADERGK